MSSLVFTTNINIDVRITHFNLQGFTGSSTTSTSTTTTTERIMPPPSFSMSSGSPSPLRRQKRFDLSDLVDNADALYKPETFLTRQLWKGKHLLLRRSFVYTSAYTSSTYASSSRRALRVVHFPLHGAGPLFRRRLDRFLCLRLLLREKSPDQIAFTT